MSLTIKKRYVVLGVNNNQKYLYYLPLVCWAWKYFGWEPLVYYCVGADLCRLLNPLEELVFSFQKSWSIHVPGYKSETVAQCARLYASSEVIDYDDYNTYLMTSDVDMLPLTKNTFHYEGHRVLAIGRDLTDYHYPICYVGARADIWRNFMKINGSPMAEIMARDMRQQKNMWTLDQDILTEKLLAYGVENIQHSSRGTDKRTGYPIGRVDRSHWTLDHKTFVDAHLPHDVLTNEKSFKNVMHLLHTLWPKQDWKWFLEYTKNFKKLL